MALRGFDQAGIFDGLAVFFYFRQGSRNQCPGDRHVDCFGAGVLFAGNYQPIICLLYDRKINLITFAVAMLKSTTAGVITIQINIPGI